MRAANHDCRSGLMGELGRRKAKATSMLHAAMTAWFIAPVGAAAALGWWFGDEWVGAGGDSGADVIPGLIAGGVMAIVNIPVIVAFELGQKVLFELMDLNHAAGTRAVDVGRQD